MRLTRFPHFISLPLQHTTVIASSFHHLVKIGDGCQIGPSCHFYTPVSTPPSPFSFDALIFLFLKECLVNVFISLTSVSVVVVSQGHPVDPEERRTYVEWATPITLGEFSTVHKIDPA